MCIIWASAIIFTVRFRYIINYIYNNNNCVATITDDTFYKYLLETSQTLNDY